jgi:hypothetical protein
MSLVPATDRPVMTRIIVLDNLPPPGGPCRHHAEVHGVPQWQHRDHGADAQSTQTFAYNAVPNFGDIANSWQPAPIQPEHLGVADRRDRAIGRGAAFPDRTPSR